MRYGLYEPGCPDLLVELGVSTAMRRGDAELARMRSALISTRAALVRAGDLDPSTEPVPMLGRSDRLDVLSLASCVCGLVRRAAASAGCRPQEIADRVGGLLRDGADTGAGQGEPRRVG